MKNAAQAVNNLTGRSNSLFDSNHVFETSFDNIAGKKAIMSIREDPKKKTNGQGGMFSPRTGTSPPVNGNTRQRIELVQKRNTFL